MTGSIKEKIFHLNEERTVLEKDHIDNMLTILEHGADPIATDQQRRVVYDYCKRQQVPLELLKQQLKEHGMHWNDINQTFE